MSELCERMSFYSVSANLVLFLTNAVGMSPSSANSLALAWSGTVYITPILGAWIADSYLGRFRTILVFSLIYILGMGGIAVGSLNDYGSSQSWIFITSIFIVALGTGIFSLILVLKELTTVLSYNFFFFHLLLAKIY